MKAPFFWYQPPGVLSALLSPLGWLYGKVGAFIRMLKVPQRFPIPILSIGNIVCGGAGKTPTAIALAQLLQGRGIKVHFVTRGYGGLEKGPLEVDILSHQPWQVGDESLLLAQHAPTWVAKERPLGVQKAMEKGADLIILDDGHQTTSLYKDLSFVVVDKLQAFGNGCVMPAGPLRENLSEGIERSDAFIGVGEDAVSPFRPSFRGRYIFPAVDLPLNRVFAFCGLGFPQKFYKTLTDLGAELVGTKSFPDHYMYKEEDFIRLEKLAKDHKAVLITTRKDFVKIPASWQERLHVLDISFQFEDSEGLYNFILQHIPSLKGVA